MYDQEKIFKNVYKYDEMKRKQHMAVRQTVGWYYYTHHLVEVKGEDAAAFLDWIFMNPVANLKVGCGRYSQMLNEDGIIIDDCVITRQGEEEFWISTLYIYELLEWLNAHVQGRKVEFRRITEEWDMISVQGPNARLLINTIAQTPVDELKMFHMRDNQIGEIPVKIAKAGFTGEKIGYELYFDPSRINEIREILEREGKAYGAEEVTDVQVMIWTLPTEKGFYLMVDMRETNPFEVGFNRIKWEHDFIGKEALKQIEAEGVKRKLMGFTVEDERAHIACRSLQGPGCAVMLDDEEIGRVTKFTYSYILDKPNGYALIEADKAVEGQHVWMNGYEAVLCDKVFC